MVMGIQFVSPDKVVTSSLLIEIAPLADASPTRQTLAPIPGIPSSTAEKCNSRHQKDGGWYICIY
jgi:hypothetical protein